MKSDLNISGIEKTSYNTIQTSNQDHIKEFFSKQSRILEEMSILKNDLQFIVDNRTKSKLKEKLDHSTISLNESALNTSILSNVSTHTIKKKYNIRENIDTKSCTKFQEFLESFNENKNLLLFVDGGFNMWELVKRNDLNVHNLLNYENITSILNKNKYFIEDKLLNIEIKENDEGKSVMDLDISKVTDLNISQFE
jgi:hypothetical protein